MNWLEVQEFGTTILAQGFNKLSHSSAIEISQVEKNLVGNYLFSLSKEPFYVGQSQDIKKRLKQHDKKGGKSRRLMEESPDMAVEIVIQIIENQFGRKDLEEYIMFLAKAKYNQGNSTRQFSEASMLTMSKEHLSWDAVQENSEKLLEMGLTEIKAGELVPWQERMLPASPGVYLIKKDQEILYVGETMCLRKRFLAHNAKTRFSALRRSIAKECLGIELKTKAELGNRHSTDLKRKYVSTEEDALITRFLQKCQLSFLPTTIGRFELESYLISKLAPKLNKTNDGIG